MKAAYSILGFSMSVRWYLLQNLNNKITRKNASKFQSIFFSRTTCPYCTRVFTLNVYFTLYHFPQISKRLFPSTCEYDILKKTLRFCLVYNWLQNNAGHFLLFYFSPALRFLFSFLTSILFFLEEDIKFKNIAIFVSKLCKMFPYR